MRTDQHGVNHERKGKTASQLRHAFHDLHASQCTRFRCTRPDVAKDFVDLIEDKINRYDFYPGYALRVLRCEQRNDRLPIYSELVEGCKISLNSSSAARIRACNCK